MGINTLVGAFGNSGNVPLLIFNFYHRTRNPCKIIGAFKAFGFADEHFCTIGLIG